jgi:hypothetical protein
MPDTSRVLDLWDGICCCHSKPTCIPMGGWIIEGSGDCGASAFTQARQQDMTIGYCGHPGNIVTSSATCLCNSRGKARVGDQVNGCNIGQIITGAPDFQSGG